MDRGQISRGCLCGFAEHYLRPRHRDEPRQGCVFAALGADAARSGVWCRALPVRSTADRSFRQIGSRQDQSRAPPQRRRRHGGAGRRAPSRPRRRHQGQQGIIRRDPRRHPTRVARKRKRLNPPSPSLCAGRPAKHLIDQQYDFAYLLVRIEHGVSVGHCRERKSRQIWVRIRPRSIRGQTCSTSSRAMRPL